MMITLTSCAICEGHYSLMREHCPYCGARRAFIANHSYQSYRVVISARDSQRLERELVRAFSTTFCEDERAVVDSPADFD